MTCTVLLLTDEVLGDWGAIVISVFAAVLFGTLWFVLPLLRLRRDINREARAAAKD
jgi:ABC-type uncharacterized transport system permease subunit